jgi:hypothetical protein
MKCVNGDGGGGEYVLVSMLWKQYSSAYSVVIIPTCKGEHFGSFYKNLGSL